MGCVSRYCSNSYPNIIISKDKQYTATIVSNILTNQKYSSKTNNKFLNLNSSRRGSENMEDSSIVQTNKRHAYSHKNLKIPENPFPFVKVKPKKIMFE